MGVSVDPDEEETTESCFSPALIRAGGNGGLSFAAPRGISSARAGEQLSGVVAVEEAPTEDGSSSSGVVASDSDKSKTELSGDDDDDDVCLPRTPSSTYAFSWTGLLLAGFCCCNNTSVASAARANASSYSFSFNASDIGVCIGGRVKSELKSHEDIELRLVALMRILLGTSCLS